MGSGFISRSDDVPDPVCKADTRPTEDGQPYLKRREDTRARGHEDTRTVSPTHCLFNQTANRQPPTAREHRSRQVGTSVPAGPRPTADPIDVPKRRGIHQPTTKVSRESRCLR